MLFYIAAFLVFMSVAVLPFFMMERSSFLRERSNGAYGVVSWVSANFLCSLPGLALISILSTACVVPLAGLNASPHLLRRALLLARRRRGVHVPRWRGLNVACAVAVGRCCLLPRHQHT